MRSLDESLVNCSPINTKLDRAIELVVETLENLKITVVTRFATIETTSPSRVADLTRSIEKDFRAKLCVRSNRDCAYMECNSLWKWVKKRN
jgi:isopropylmalate/homocitrate/citramalate synthase